ncbi:MAG: DMT family transporter [Rhodobacteraceae bacterium]|nr:DMT family transporter [Paracoccaceae bacterium]
MGGARSNLRGAGFALLAFGIFATHDVIVKFLGAHYAPFQIVFFSTLLGFPLVTLMLIGDRTDGNLRPRHPWWSLARTVAATVTGAAAFYAFATLPLAQVYAILFASPLIITLLAIPILGETVRLRRGAAVVAGLVGVLIVLRPGGVELGLGHLAAVTAACTGAFASIVVRKIGNEERSAVLLLYPMLGNFAAMGAVLPFVYEPMPMLHLAGLALIAAMGLAGMLGVIAAYRRAEAVIVAPMQYSQILWATVYGYLLFGETIDAPTALGAAVIIASGIYIVLRESRLGSSRTPVLETRSRPETGTAPRASLLTRLRGPRAGEAAGEGARSSG